MRKLMVTAILMAVVHILSPVVGSRAQQIDPLLQKAAALKKNLEEKGFQVRGDINYARFTQINPATMYCAGQMDTCNGFNFQGGYLAAMVPSSPGQAATMSAPLFRIRKNEAVVLVGPTPPPCDFFSYTCWLFYRHEQGWGPRNQHKIYSNIGETLNNSVIRAGKDPFNKNVVLSFTSDEETNKAVRTAALRAGFPGEVFNTYVLPSSVMKTNDALDETTDQFLIVQRTALWRDGSEDGAGYIKHPGVVVLRVTPPDNTPHKPLPGSKQRVRGSGTTETDYGPAVDQLREAILRRHSNLPAQELTTSQWLMESPLAIQTTTNTLGDSADTVYLGTEQAFKLSDSPDDFVIAYGVNHQKSGKCVYHNINVYKKLKACGVASAFDHCNGNPDCVAFAGSAQAYLSQVKGAKSDQLYALKIARHCQGEPYCLEVPTGACGVGAGLDDELFLGFRAYLEPKTKTGPAYNELLFDKVIHFSPAPAPTLSLASHLAEGEHPGPVSVRFQVSSKTPGDAVWEAKLEHVDDESAGVIEPVQGVIAGGSGEASFAFKAKNPGIYYVKITAKDQQSRFAATEVQINVKKGSPD